MSDLEGRPELPFVRVVLERLACLGNGNRHGNSHGNMIAIDALAELDDKQDLAEAEQEPASSALLEAAKLAYEWMSFTDDNNAEMVQWKREHGMMQEHPNTVIRRKIREAIKAEENRGTVVQDTLRPSDKTADDYMAKDGFEPIGHEIEEGYARERLRDQVHDLRAQVADLHEEMEIQHTRHRAVTEDLQRHIRIVSKDRALNKELRAERAAEKRRAAFASSALIEASKAVLCQITLNTWEEQTTGNRHNLKTNQAVIDLRRAIENGALSPVSYLQGSKMYNPQPNPHQPKNECDPMLKKIRPSPKPPFKVGDIVKSKSTGLYLRVVRTDIIHVQGSQMLSIPFSVESDQLEHTPEKLDFKVGDKVRVNVESRSLRIGTVIVRGNQGDFFHYRVVLDGEKSKPFGVFRNEIEIANG